MSEFEHEHDHESQPELAQDHAAEETNLNQESSQPGESQPSESQHESTLAAEQQEANQEEATRDQQSAFAPTFPATGSASFSSPNPGAVSAANPNVAHDVETTPTETQARMESPEDSKAPVASPVDALTMAKFDINRGLYHLRQSSSATVHGTIVHDAITHFDAAIARLDHTAFHARGKKDLSEKDHAELVHKYETSYRNYVPQPAPQPQNEVAFTPHPEPPSQLDKPQEANPRANVA